MPGNRRKSLVHQPGAVPLFVVAGLPKATSVQVERQISAGFSKPCRVVYAAASSSDNTVYNFPYVRTLTTAIAQFAIRRRLKGKRAQPTPSFIYLLYVPTADKENLLSFLDFTVFPIALGELAARNKYGKMLRHIPSAVHENLSRIKELVVKSYHVDERVKTARPKDALLLPPKNFHLDKSSRMHDLFLEMRLGQRDWNDRYEELTPRQFNSSTLSSIKGNRNQFCFQDCRQIAFYQPHVTAYHGGQWEVDEIEALTAVHILRGLYRFGAPIPRGFHHDAQLEGGVAFKNQLFECADKGSILVSATHANVYPNDFVRIK